MLFRVCQNNDYFLLAFLGQALVPLTPSDLNLEDDADGANQDDDEQSIFAELRGGQKGTFVLPLQPIHDGFRPEGSTHNQLPFTGGDIVPQDGKVHVQVIPFPKGTSAAGWFKHDQGLGGWKTKWCVLAGQQIDIYQSFGDSAPSQTILLHPDSANMGRHSPRKRSQSSVQKYDFPSGYLNRQDKDILFSASLLWSTILCVYLLFSQRTR